MLHEAGEVDAGGEEVLGHTDARGVAGDVGVVDAGCFGGGSCEGEPARDTLDFTAEVVQWVTVKVWVVTCHPVTGGGLAAAGLAKSAAGAARVAANVGYTGAAVALICTGRWVYQTVRG